MGTLIRNGIVTSGLVLHLDAKNTKSYPGSGTVWNDLSGNNNSGSLINGVGYSNGAMVFDGTNDSVKSQPIIFTTNVITVNIWFYWNIYANNDALLIELSANGNVNQNTFVIDPNSSAPTSGKFQLTLFGNGAGQYFGVYIERPDVGWHFLSVIFDNSTITGDIICYLDGKLETSTINKNLKNTSGNFKVDNLYVMSRNNSSLHGNGKIANVSIYNRALTPSEISQNFNATKTRYNI